MPPDSVYNSHRASADGAEVEHVVDALFDGLIEMGGVAYGSVDGWVDHVLAGSFTPRIRRRIKERFAYRRRQLKSHDIQL